MALEDSCGVIVLNWRRPANIAAIAKQVVEAVPQAALYIIDQAEPQNRITGVAELPWDTIWYRAHENRGPGVRIDLAAQLPYDRFLCIDDDVFLEATQIRGLLFALDQDPGRAHGIAGQMARVFKDSLFLSGCQNGNKRASILNQVYAFTQNQARAAVGLASVLGYSCCANIRNGEDIVLSCAGLAPQLHDLGRVRLCPTSYAPGIAMWKEPEFSQERVELAGRLYQLGRLTVTPAPADEIAIMFPDAL